MKLEQTTLTADTRSDAQRPPARISLRPLERKLLLGAVELVCANLALAAAVAWRFGMPVRWALTVRPSWYLVLSSVWLAVAFLLGSYALRRAARLTTGTATGAATALIAAVVYLLIPYVTPPLPTSRLALLVLVGAMVGSVMAWRALYALVLVQPALRRKALIIGGGWAGRTILDAIRISVPDEYDLVGFVDDDPHKQGSAIDDLPVLGTRADLRSVVTRTGVSEIIVAITQADRMHLEMFQAIMDCHERGIAITQMPLLFEQLTGRVPVEHAGRNLHVVLPLNDSPSRVRNSVKRLGDIVVGTVGVAVTLVLLPLVWLAMRVEGRGPVFLRQTRVGQGGRFFDLIKFRTMVLQAESEGPQWASENDPRVTRVGRILRRLHVDEIPQAVNMLRGELSFVGPRPERPEFVAQLEKQIPFFRARHGVKPGITGWAQVNYRYGASVEDALIKLQYDLYYIKHHSLWLDLLILIRTIGLVLTLRGR